MDRDLDWRIGARVGQERAARGWTLSDLAERSGVSRAMISRIERGEASATAALLDRLCAGLGILLSDLFTSGGEAEEPLRRHADQPVWQDPASGYVRRSVSPRSSRTGIVEVEMPRGASVLLDAPRDEARLDQQIWLLAGLLTVSLGSRDIHLAAGDCLHVLLDGPIRYANPGDETARYAVIVAPAVPDRKMP